MTEPQHIPSALREQAARVLATTVHAWGVPVLSIQPTPCPPRKRFGTTRAARAARRMHRALSAQASVGGLFFSI